MIAKGNHKLAIVSENKVALDEAFDKEVKKSWMIPFPIYAIKKIPGASVTPLGVAVQFTIDKDSNKILKRRTTHDCKFKGPSGLSCNERTKT